MAEPSKEALAFLDWLVGAIERNAPDKDLALALDRFRAEGVEAERALALERIETFAFGAEGAGHEDRAQTARDVAGMLRIVDRVFGS